MTRRPLPLIVLLALSSAPVFARPLASSDLFRMRSAASVSISPDGTRIAYAVENNGPSGRAYRQHGVARRGVVRLAIGCIARSRYHQHVVVMRVLYSVFLYRTRLAAAQTRVDDVRTVVHRPSDTSRHRLVRP